MRVHDLMGEQTASYEAILAEGVSGRKIMLLADSALGGEDAGKEIAVVLPIR